MSDSSVWINRNVLYSRLLLKKASSKSSEFCKQVLVARYGLPAGNQEEDPESAELWVFKGSHNPANTSSQPPKFIIPLQGARLEQILLPKNSGGSDGGSSGGGGDDEGVANNGSSSSDDGSNCSLVGQITGGGDGDCSSEGGGSSCSDGSRKGVGYEVRRLSAAPDNSLFGLTTADGRSYHFWVLDKEEHKTWTNLLKFLIVFPHSTLPVVPNYNPTELHDNFDPILYNADSVWPIYIPPDEIGLRCGIQGPRVLTLQNQKPGLSMSKLEIYSMTDHQVPLFSCKHNEIRRTGKMGLFLYVEVGRRNKYGAGLLWMYFGSSNEQASSMRDLLSKFLLQQKCDVTPRLRRASEPILISTLTSTRLQKHNKTQAHCSSLPPPLPPRRCLEHIHFNNSLPRLTTATSKEDSARTPTSPTPGSRESTFQNQNQKCFLVSEMPHEGTGQDQKYSSHQVLEPRKKSVSESECSNHYHILEPQKQPNSDNYYHVLETLQENVSDKNSQHYPVLEPKTGAGSIPKQHHYHTLEPNVATAYSMELHHYDTVDLKRMRRYSEQQQHLPLRTNAATWRSQSVDIAYSHTTV